MNILTYYAYRNYRVILNYFTMAIFSFFETIFERILKFSMYLTEGQRELMFYMFKNLIDLFKRFVS